MKISKQKLLFLFLIVIAALGCVSKKTQSAETEAYTDDIEGYTQSIRKRAIDTSEVLITKSGKTKVLSQAVGNTSKLVYVYSDHNCGLFIEHALYFLKINKSKLAPSKILLLYGGTQLRKLKIYAEEFEPYNVFLAKEKPITFGSKTLALPYFYVLSKNSNTPQEVFIPKKEDNKRTEKYLEKIAQQL